MRPPQARKEKPRVSAFTSADIEKIEALKPNLVLAFSDLQADIVAGLIRRGIAVHAFNQRSVAEIFDMIGMLGAMVGAKEEADRLSARLKARVDDVRRRGEALARRPRVMFEEWDDPLISGIKWVSELIGIAGGIDVFAERASCELAKDRIVTHEDAIARVPDIIIGSWCGKKFSADKVKARPGYDAVPAVRDGQLHEIKSPLILQPGPAALTDGLDAVHGIITRWA